MKKYVFIVFLIPLGLSGQSLENWVIGSGGEATVSSGIQLAWTLGEPSTATLASKSGWITEGFHQTYPEILPINIPRISPSKLGIQIFPNPAADHVQIKFDDNVPGTYDLKLYDRKGQLLKYLQMQHSHQNNLSLEGLPSGIYLISVQLNEADSSSPHSFQIIKH